MNTELRNKAWQVLPKEFKEEVNEIYLNAVEHHPCGYNHKTDLLKYLFGKHNLTSDVEGEEMLTCDRDVVRMLYDRADSVKVRQTLESLFGSKCLPDEGTDCTPVEVGVAENATTSNVDSSHGNVESLEPKPSIPKFKHKLGDKVRIVNDWSYGYKHNGEVTEIVAIDESDPEVPYKVDIYDEEEGGDLWYQESDLEPYTEPTNEGTHQEQCVPKNAESGTRSINRIKDSFRDERRLNIAAMITASIYSSDTIAKQFNSIEEIVRKALDIADTLIAEAELIKQIKDGEKDKD